MKRAYQIERNSCNKSDRRQSNYPYWTSQVWNDCSYGDRRRLNYNKFDSQEKNKSGNCSQFDREVERGDRDRFYGDRRSNHGFDFRRRNSRNCSQSFKNRRGW